METHPTPLKTPPKTPIIAPSKSINFDNGSHITYYEFDNPLIENLLTPILPTLTYYGGKYDEHSVSREQVWFHEDIKPFHPDWSHLDRWKAHPYTSTLLSIQEHIKKTTASLLKAPKFRPNSILINRYRTGQNIIPKHRDREDIFGDNPIIAIYSLGASRTLRFTPIEPNTRSLKAISSDIVDIKMRSNSLTIMSGTTQKHFCHELVRDTSIKEPRYSLTFREHNFTK